MFILIFLLFLVVGIIKLVSGQFADAGILLGLCTVILLFALWVDKEKKQALQFLNWIKSAQEDLKKGWAYYSGQKITLRTEVTQYQGCISFFIMTSRFRSRYLVGGNHVGEWLIFTLPTFLFGWWGFPWGFIFTPQALYRNLRGGYRLTVAELLANVDQEIEKLTNPRTARLSTIFKNAKAEASA